MLLFCSASFPHRDQYNLHSKMFTLMVACQVAHLTTTIDDNDDKHDDYDNDADNGDDDEQGLEKLVENHLSRNDHVRHESVGLLQGGSRCVKLRRNACQRVRVCHLLTAIIHFQLYVSK